MTNDIKELKERFMKVWAVLPEAERSRCCAVVQGKYPIMYSISWEKIEEWINPKEPWQLQKALEQMAKEEII